MFGSEVVMLTGFPGVLVGCVSFGLIRVFVQI
jgi:hypothetical protein